MKKFLILFMVLVSSLFPAIDERMNDVYFANGIDTEKKHAYEIADKLKDKFKTSHQYEYNLVKSWDIAYNHTHGIGIDLYESMLQKIYEDSPGTSLVPLLFNHSEITGYFSYTFNGIVTKAAKKLPKDVVSEYASKAAKTLAKKTVSIYNQKYGKHFTQEQIELMFNAVFDHLIDKAVGAYINLSEEEIIAQEKKDVQSHVIKYKESIRNGHQVIVVAHSQGNLFVNRAYNLFGEFANVNRDEWMKNYITTIGVATPTNNILGAKTPYITFVNDMIQLVPDSLSPNTTNPRRYYIHNAVGEKVETLFSVKAHDFLKSYMATDATRNAILNFIDTSIENHKTADSQWGIKEETGKNTENHKITVKHLYDSTISMGDTEVYPFNTDKKLYQVKDETGGNGWVKASYGGSEVLEYTHEENAKKGYQLKGTTPLEYIIGNDRIFVVLSVDHRVGRSGMYFNFNIKEVDEIMGHTGWHDYEITLKNNRSGQVDTAVMWRNRNGGSIGDGHGRWHHRIARGGQWVTGDEITITDLELRPRTN